MAQPNRDVINALLRSADEAAARGDTDLAEAIRGVIALANDELRLRHSLDLRDRMVAHGARMDRLRHYVAIALILVLFAVINSAVLVGVSGQDVAQFAAPISGLAGIAIGWLFGGGTQNVVPSTAPPTPSELTESSSSPPSIYIGGSNFGQLGPLGGGGEPQQGNPGRF